MNACRLLGMTLLALLSAGCATRMDSLPEADGGGIEVVGIIIRNQLVYTVTDVLIEAPASGAFAGCGNIMPRSQCSTSFPAATYQGNPVVISWKEYGQPHGTDEFVVKVPDGMPAGSQAWLEVRVFAPGQAGALLISDPVP